MTKRIPSDSGSKVALRDMGDVIKKLTRSAKQPKAVPPGGATEPAGTTDPLKQSRQDARKLAEMQPPAQAVRGANQFGSGKLQPTPKETRPVEDVANPGDASLMAYDKALANLDVQISSTMFVNIQPRLRLFDKVAEAAGIPHDQVVADVKNRLAAWEGGTGVSLAGKLRDVYAHYKLPIDDATNRKLNEVAAPGGAAAKEKLAKEFEVALRNLSQVSPSSDGFVSTLGRLGSMSDHAKALSAYADKPAEAKQRIDQTFNEAAVHVLKCYSEKIETGLKAQPPRRIDEWNRRNSLNGLEGFVQKHGGLLSPEARQEAAVLADVLKHQKKTI